MNRVSNEISTQAIVATKKIIKISISAILMLLVYQIIFYPIALSLRQLGYSLPLVWGLGAISTLMSFGVFLLLKRKRCALWIESADEENVIIPAIITIIVFAVFFLFGLAITGICGDLIRYIENAFALDDRVSNGNGNGNYHLYHFVTSVFFEETVYMSITGILSFHAIKRAWLYKKLKHN